MSMTDSELVAYLREHLMLEVIKPGEPFYGGGTEGRVPAMLWFLPFGKNKNNQFGEIIKMGIARVGVNSYDDAVLTLFEQLLGPCDGTTPAGARAFAVRSAAIPQGASSAGDADNQEAKP